MADASGCHWVAPPCATQKGRIPDSDFVPTDGKSVVVPDVSPVAASSLVVTGGFVSGASVGNGKGDRREPILCAFPLLPATRHAGEGMATGAWPRARNRTSARHGGGGGSSAAAFLVSIEDGPPGRVLQKIVLLELSVTGPDPNSPSVVTATAVQAGFFTGGLGRCASAQSLADAWDASTRFPQAATCTESGGPGCDGHADSGKL